MSKTKEGADQEGTTLQASQFGETSLTDTREGADKPEAADNQTFDASYSHF